MTDSASRSGSPSTPAWMKPLPPPRMWIRTFGFLFWVAVVLAGCGGSTAANPETTMFLPESVGDWVRRDSVVTYDRETIFDYINGAGEVYRSYAFADVLVARYEQVDQSLNVELFDMGTSEDAYGVFSYAREHGDTGIGAGYERKGGVLCFWQDRFYVCVATEQASDDMGTALEDVARGISQRLPPSGERPALVGVLPPAGLVPFSDRFFHTHQTLNYHYYLERENILNLGSGTDVVLARYEPGPAYLMVIDYGNDGDATRALASFRDHYLQDSGAMETVETDSGKFVASARQGQFVVVVLDAATESAAGNLLRAATQMLTQNTS